jgi:hypothetical protein
LEKWSAVLYPGYDGKSIIDRNRIKKDADHVSVYDKTANDVRGLIDVPMEHFITLCHIIL